MKIVTIVLILMIASVLSVSATSQTEISDFLLNYTLLEENDTMKVDADLIYATTKCEMTKNEMVKAARFARKFGRDTRGLNDSQKITYGIRLLANTATYETGKKRLSDVLNGTANCQGYSMMMHELMKIAGIECELEISKNHIWNIINGDKIDMTVLNKVFRR